MKLYVFLLNVDDGALLEPELVMESEDRDALKERAQELAKEICEADDPTLVWQAGSDGDEELLVEIIAASWIRT